MNPNEHPHIIGWSHAAFGKRAEPDTTSLMGLVSADALAHAELAAEDLDAIFVGVYNNGFSRQDFQAALVAIADDRLGRIPATRLENACATGSAAVFAALDFVAAGRGRTALVVGAEKMTSVPGEQVGDILLSASYRAEEERYGSFAGIFGFIAETYFERYGDQRDVLARIAAKNHRNGVANPWAQIRKDLGFEFCNEVSARNPMVAGPLRRTDCSLVSDGAVALVIGNPEVSANARRAIGFRGRSHANDVLPLSRRDPLEFAGARQAFGVALADAAVGVTELDLIESHDCFTIAELLQYEAFGLAEPGKGRRVVDEGLAERDGVLPINVSGGLKAKGHPIGATGVSMHALAAMQLAGEAGELQLPAAELAAVFNMGGAAVANYASVLERVA